MTWYRLFVTGENFPFEWDGEQVLMGWCATRWVEAANPDEARIKVLEALRSEPSLAGVPKDCGARVGWEETVEVEASEVPSIQGGLAFFQMED